MYSKNTFRNRFYYKDLNYLLIDLNVKRLSVPVGVSLIVVGVAYLCQPPLKAVLGVDVSPDALQLLSEQRGELLRRQRAQLLALHTLRARDHLDNTQLSFYYG